MSRCEADGISYNARISTCEKNVWWQQAGRWEQDAARRRVISLIAVMGQRWQRTVAAGFQFACRSFAVSAGDLLVRGMGTCRPSVF
eukprot:7906298-Pyramimonas_sp.AAC.1